MKPDGGLGPTFYVGVCAFTHSAFHNNRECFVVPSNFSAVKYVIFSFIVLQIIDEIRFAK